MIYIIYLHLQTALWAYIILHVYAIGLQYTWPIWYLCDYTSELLVNMI